MILPRNFITLTRTKDSGDEWTQPMQSPNLELSLCPVSTATSIFSLDLSTGDFLHFILCIINIITGRNSSKYFPSRSHGNKQWYINALIAEKPAIIRIFILCYHIFSRWYYDGIYWNPFHKSLCYWNPLDWISG